MRRLSISTITLAVILAMSSSFIVKSKPFAANTWERFGVQNSQVSSWSPTAAAVKAKRIFDGFRKVSASTMSSINTEIANYNAVQIPGSAVVRCGTNSDYVCGAIISYKDNDNTELTLVHWNTGDYSLVP